MAYTTYVKIGQNAGGTVYAHPFQKSFTHNLIPCEVAAQIGETGEHRIYVYVDGALQGEARTATDGTLEICLGTAEMQARHIAGQARLGSLNTDSELIKLLRRLGYTESQQ